MEVLPLYLIKVVKLGKKVSLMIFHRMDKGGAIKKSIIKEEVGKRGNGEFVAGYHSN